MLPEMPRIPPEELARLIETLTFRPAPPRRQDPIAHVFELAEDAFRRVLALHRMPPQFERVTWWRQAEREEVRFEASFSRPELSWFWAVDTARLYSDRDFIDGLERSDLRGRLQEMWRAMVDNRLQQGTARREREALERLTLRAGSFAIDPPIVYGADLAGGVDTTTIQIATITNAFRIDARELVEARNRTATEVRGLGGMFARPEGERFRDMYGGPCQCYDCREARSPARRTAEARGEKLLREWLSPAQRKQYERDFSFDVIGGSSGQRYRITRAPSYNVLEIRGDQLVVALWCFLPAGALVVGDVMLAQKVALETNERGALQVANRRLLSGQTGIRPGMVSFAFDEMVMVREPAPRPAVLRQPRQPRQPEIDPRSWMAGWGDLGRDLAAARQGLTSRAARRARR